MHKVLNAAYCYLRFLVCVCLCVAVSLFDITMSCAKMAEPIEMLFGMWTRMSPRVGFPTPSQGAIFGGREGAPL